MASLTPAHRGYEYQDLLSAYRVVDLLLGQIKHVHVDEKLVPDDRFDDLTLVTCEGARERIQFKHTENSGRSLSLTTFTTDTRKLRLDCLIQSILRDHAGPGHTAASYLYRIVLRDGPPVEPDLLALLEEVGASDPGPCVASTATQRFRFRADALWHQGFGPECDSPTPCFSFLTEPKPFSREQLELVCKELVIEVAAPPASGDLTHPDISEQALLNRMTAEIGAGSFPNHDRTDVDLAAAIISSVRAARQGRGILTLEELLRRARLRSDFGAVSRAHPVDPSLEVLRPDEVGLLTDLAKVLSTNGGVLKVVGPPGQGKSWVCQQAIHALEAEGWLVAEHYCYLGDADRELNERVLSERIFGSLIGRLAEADPSIVTEQRPRFSANEEALEACLRRATAEHPARRVALFIDGVDHITRVRSVSGRKFDPSTDLCEALSGLSLPSGGVVVVLSQPGPHLLSLDSKNSGELTVAGLDRPQLRQLLNRLGVTFDELEDELIRETPLGQQNALEELVDALELRSRGNALYATYLCREVRRNLGALADSAEIIRDLPEFDGTLENYYGYLYEALGPHAGWVADVVALADFPLTRAELKEIRPDGSHYVDGALALLAPVLIETTAQNGLRVYHESFARYLRRSFQDNHEAQTALLRRISAWLEDKGFLRDERAFRSLLPLLAAAGDDQRIVELIDRKCVAKAVAAGFPASSIAENLAVASGAAFRLGDWPLIIRCIELARAAQSFEYERFTSILVRFADVPASLHGVDTLSNRLLFSDILMISARDGLQMCAALDQLGARVPWENYITGFDRESPNSNTVFGEDSDQTVSLALLRGKLRIASTPNSNTTSSRGELLPEEGQALDRFTPEAALPLNTVDNVKWDRVASWVESQNFALVDIVEMVFTMFGKEGMSKLLAELQHPGGAYLAYAELLTRLALPDDGTLSPLRLAQQAVLHGPFVGSVRQLLALGISPEKLASARDYPCGQELIDLTQELQRWTREGDEVELDLWLDAICLAAYRDPGILIQLELLVVGEGWFRCWLRFSLSLSGAIASATDRDALILEALRKLLSDTNPFSGELRACDLYRTLPSIRQNIRNAIDLLTPESWEEGLNILHQISTSTTTSLRGSVSGPVAPDFLMQLTVDSAPLSVFPIADRFVLEGVTKGAADRYYSDLAEYRLIAARLAVRAGDLARVNALWEEACELLCAYGYHKDITIYGLLDPMPELIQADPLRARQSVAAMQAVCERVPLHTDGKSLRGVWSTWWKLLAKADPVAAVELVSPALLSRCNDLDELLDGALANVWEEWSTDVEPFLSGLLRLTLEKTMDERDSTLITALSGNSAHGKGPTDALSTWLMARADERHVAYSYSNSYDLLAKDAVVLKDLNAAAAAAGILGIGPVDIKVSKRAEQRPERHSRPNGAALLDRDTQVTFPSGEPGLNRACRAWRRRPYDAHSQEWTVERFANLIGYRLLEVSAEGKTVEADAALRSLAQSTTLGPTAELLSSVAEGLARHGENRLAAVAWTLAWTSSRGGGGWMAFGGQTHLESLKHASDLDTAAALRTVAEEVERQIASNYGPFGITQALILAFASEALQPQDASSIDLGFAMWDEALAIISARAPRVAGRDDPDHPYTPPCPDPGTRIPGDLAKAFGSAVFAGLFHPGRERKRRTLLAIRLLLQYFPQLSASAIKTALSNLSDPANLSWLLATVRSIDGTAEQVSAANHADLGKLSSSGWLTVRSLARSLLGEAAPALPISSVPDSALLPETMRIVPVGAAVSRSGFDASVISFVHSAAGSRLARAEDLLVGLTSAVESQAMKQMTSEPFRERMRAQLRSMSSNVEKRWPDAFLANAEAVETILQTTAAGSRAALLAHGEPVQDGAAWEEELASILLDDPDFPVLLEASRQPRPRIAPPLNATDPRWSHIRAHIQGTCRTETKVEAAGEAQGLLFSTLNLIPYTNVFTVDIGEFAGWKWLGTAECRLIQLGDWTDRNEQKSIRYIAAEVRDMDDRDHLDHPPATAGNVNMWRALVYPAEPPNQSVPSQPLLGTDYELAIAGDSHGSLGVPPSALTPTPLLLALLSLTPTDRMRYADALGPGLALVTWRAEYERSEYQQCYPKLTGSGVVIRPDLWLRLLTAVGEQRLILRDFVFGPNEITAQA